MSDHVITKNRFDDCESIEQTLGQALGAVSTCWERLDLAGEFQSEKASAVLDESLERIRVLAFQPD
jgi:hypothetical protein